jgi:hypothetical protein
MVNLSKIYVEMGVKSLGKYGREGDVKKKGIESGFSS